jgi:hypothetical protein
MKAITLSELALFIRHDPASWHWTRERLAPFISEAEATFPHRSSRGNRTENLMKSGLMIPSPAVIRQ